MNKIRKTNNWIKIRSSAQKMQENQYKKKETRNTVLCQPEVPLGCSLNHRWFGFWPAVWKTSSISDCNNIERRNCNPFLIPLTGDLHASRKMTDESNKSINQNQTMT